MNTIFILSSFHLTTWHRRRGGADAGGDGVAGGDGGGGGDGDGGGDGGGCGVL